MRTNNRGVILITVLWVILILSLVAWGLSRRSALEASLFETYQGKLRSYAAARAGINTVLNMMDKFPSTKDTLYSSGIAVPQGKTAQDIFSHVDVGGHAYAIVQWSAQGFSGDGKPHLEYGLEDEASKININAINDANTKILSALFVLKGLSTIQADSLAQAISDFKQPNKDTTNKGWLARDSDQEAFKPKGKPYEDVLELLEVSGMTKEIFEQIKDDVTVYGDITRGLWVNVNTANNDVIQALANAASPGDASAAAKIVVQACTLRDGMDGLSFTADDGLGSLSDTGAPALQQGISSYVRARVVGVDENTGVRTTIDAIIHRTTGINQNQIVGWQRD